MWNNYSYVANSLAEVETARDLDMILEQINFLEKESVARTLVKILKIVGIDDAKTYLDIYIEKG